MMEHGVCADSETNVLLEMAVLSLKSIHNSHHLEAVCIRPSILSHPIPHHSRSFQIIPDHFRSFQIHLHSIEGQHTMRLWLRRQWHHCHQDKYRQHDKAHPHTARYQQCFKEFQRFSNGYMIIMGLSGVVPKNIVIWGRISDTPIFKLMFCYQ